MRTFLSCALLLLLLVSCSIPTLAMEERASTLPVIDGGKIIFEINLSEDDFLPAIRMWVSIIPGIASATGLTPDPTEPGVTTNLEAALAELRLVSAIGYKYPPLAKPDDILQIYTDQIGLNIGWLLAMRVDDPAIVMRLYTRPGLEGIFGIMVSVEDAEVFAIRTEGKIDLPAIADWMGRLVPQIMQMIHPAAPPPPMQPGESEPPVDLNPDDYNELDEYPEPESSPSSAVSEENQTNSQVPGGG